MFAISNERSSWSRGCSFTWQRSRTAGVIAAIQVRTEGDAVRLAYQHRGPGESWKSENYWVNVEWTPCHYGGQRAWLTIVDSGVYQHTLAPDLSATLYAVSCTTDTGTAVITV